ncbi:MAG TPA: hypothetical protein VNC78_09755 [Actinomycetota bacterium]|nr:hypothetical protein [Actinomycetota bacterium]
MGLLGATEPEEGWATARRATSRGAGREREGAGERRGLVATIAREHGDFESTSSWAVAVWGVVVGGTVMALSMLLFGLA